MKDLYKNKKKIKMIAVKGFIRGINLGAVLSQKRNVIVSKWDFFFASVSCPGSRSLEQTVSV